jgi:hypothetical protein
VKKAFPSTKPTIRIFLPADQSGEKPLQEKIEVHNRYVKSEEQIVKK